MPTLTTVRDEVVPTYPTPLVIPSNSDTAWLASLSTAIRTLAQRTEYLAQNHPTIYYVNTTDPTSLVTTTRNVIGTTVLIPSCTVGDQLDIDCKFFVDNTGYTTFATLLYRCINPSNGAILYTDKSNVTSGDYHCLYNILNVHSVRIAGDMEVSLSQTTSTVQRITNVEMTVRRWRRS